MVGKDYHKTMMLFLEHALVDHKWRKVIIEKVIFGFNEAGNSLVGIKKYYSYDFSKSGVPNVGTYMNNKGKIDGMKAFGLNFQEGCFLKSSRDSFAIEEETLLAVKAVGRVNKVKKPSEYSTKAFSEQSISIANKGMSNVLDSVNLALKKALGQQKAKGPQIGR